MVATGAAATVIGIAEVQIGSSHRGSEDLWANKWFLVGFIIGILGLGCLFWALSAGCSQSKARHEFPKLSVAIDSQIPRPGPVPDPTMPFHESFTMESRPYELLECGIRITNDEIDRYASLQFVMAVDTDQGKYFFQRPFSERSPWTIGPGMSDRRPVNFEVITEVVAKPGSARIVVTDYNSRRRIAIESKYGDHPPSTWEILPN